jgi:hypothetical protein
MHTYASWDCLRCCRRKFPFLSHGKTIFHFLDTKNKFFCEATTKLKFHIAIKTIFKNTRPPLIENSPAGASETFPSTLHEKDKFLLIRQEAR